MANEKKAPPSLLCPRDIRFLYDVMVGSKQIAPRSPVENGKDGWRVYVQQTPSGKPDAGHVWVTHEDYGVLGPVATANVQWIRWWREQDKALEQFPKALRETL